jgi:hypothetical protein
MAIRRKPATTKRRIVRRRKTSLGKLTPAALKTAGKDALFGLGGGAAFGLVSSQVNNFVTDPMLNKGAKALIVLLTQTVFKQRELALGMAGAFGAELTKELGLADGNALPPMLPYNAAQMALADGFQYDSLQDGGGYFPDYTITM